MLISSERARIGLNVIRRSNPIVAKALADYADSVASGFTYTADTLAR